MSRGGNHYSRLHFAVDYDNAKTACGRSTGKVEITWDVDSWKRMESHAAGDLCAACRANVRKLEAKS